MALSLHHVSYRLPDNKYLFKNLNLSVDRFKTGLVGRNGIGKSTLLGIIAGDISPAEGSVHVDGSVYYFPQNHDTLRNMTVAEILGIDRKLTALRSILAGTGNTHDYQILNDDWNIETRADRILEAFGLTRCAYNRKLYTMSGGEITRLFFAMVEVNQPDYVLFDEPTNNLDLESFKQITDALQRYNGTLLVTPHDIDFIRKINVERSIDLG